MTPPPRPPILAPILAPFLALPLLCALAAPALAQDAAAPAAQNITAEETPWQVTCTPATGGGPLTCSMVKSLALGEGRQILAQAAIVAGAASGGPDVLRLLLPHGMDLTAGLQLSVDGAALASPGFHTSLPGGVVAASDLTPALEAALRAGNLMTIEGRQNNAGSLRLEMSLAGFSAALEKLR